MSSRNEHIASLISSMCPSVRTINSMLEVFSNFYFFRTPPLVGFFLFFRIRVNSISFVSVK